MNIKPRLLNFRALVSFHSTYGVFVAECLETGHVATADTQPMAVEMLQELIVDEVQFALKNDNLRSLLSSPLRLHEFMRWADAKAKRASQYEWMQRTLNGREFSFAIEFAFDGSKPEEAA